MKIIRMIVIASYIILGATLGVIIIPSVARDTGILHTYPWLANKYIISLIGILIFF